MTGVVAAGLLVVAAAPAFAAGPVTWSAPITLTSGDVGAGLACGSGRCVGAAVTTPGIVSSTNPRGGASAWSSSTFSDTQIQLHGMSCPSTTLCVTVDGFNGSVLDSTTPTAGASTWHSTGLSTNGHAPYAVSCPSTTLCVATDAHGGVYWSMSPGASNPSWTSIIQLTSYSGWMDGISCPTVTLCVAVAKDGRAIVSTNPKGDASAWHITDIDAVNQLLGVSCTSKPMCVAVDEFGNVLSSTNPAAVSPSWKSVHVAGSNPLNAVSCPSSGLCVAVDGAGNAYASTNPTGPATAWTRTDIDGSTALKVVSCAATSLCVAGDADGHVVTGVPNVYKPDAMIGKWGSTTLIGANVYSATAAHESLSLGQKRGGSRAFKILVKNRGNVSDRYFVTGPGNQSGWTVTYLHGTTNITKQVVAGTYEPTVRAGSTITVKTVIKVPAGATVGSSRSWLVLAKSAHDATKKDAVKATVKATT